MPILSKKFKICSVAIFLLASGVFLPVNGKEKVLYQSKWKPDGSGLEKWMIKAEQHSVGTDPKRGSFLEFESGSAILRIPAPGSHRLRFRFLTTYTKKLNAGLRSFAEKKGLPYLSLTGQQTFKHFNPDPQKVELGLVLPEETTNIEFILSSKGKITISDFQVVDLGLPPEYKPDGKELLSDPGWESIPPRSAIPKENSYRKHLNGWMRWFNSNVDTAMVTSSPSRTRSGKQAVMAIASNGGFRQNVANRIRPERYYDLSVWAKGQGAFTIYNVGLNCSPTFVVSPDEWRQFHFPVNTDNLNRPHFSMGILLRGRIFFDDFSIKEIRRKDVAGLIKSCSKWTNATFPAKISQKVPKGETRSRDAVVLENKYLKVSLSPIGGGRVVELLDKQSGIKWQKVSLLGLQLTGQIVRIDWNVPFKAKLSQDKRSVIFSHTVTGGEAVPFLDGVRIEQIFSLTSGERKLTMKLILTNTSNTTRQPSPVISNNWSSGAGIETLSTYGSLLDRNYVLQATIGQAGLLTTKKKKLRIAEPIGGWIGASTKTNSLVMGFNPKAVQKELLEPNRHTINWKYLRIPLPPGGKWETETFLASVPLDSIAYADPNVVVSVKLASVDKSNKDFTLEINQTNLTDSTQINARVIDYENRKITSAKAGKEKVEFKPPEGRFITCLDIDGKDQSYTVELFNDPPDRVISGGIEGAGQTQYTPSLPVKEIRLPDVGNKRELIAKSKKVLWCYGLFSDFYPLDDILKSKGYSVQMLEGAGGFPDELEDLLAFRMIIMANIGAKHLSAHSRAVLSQYVRAGGSLLVLGGSCGLGNAMTKGTDFEEMLPVKLKGAFEVLPLPGNDNILVPKDSTLNKLSWKDQPRVYWAHRLTVRPNAKVLASAGSQPILISWNYGKGKVFLYSGTVEGNPRKGEIPVWSWKGWLPLWREVIKLLISK